MYSTWIIPLFQPSFSLPNFLSCRSIAPSSRPPVQYPHPLFRNLYGSSLEFPPLCSFQCYELKPLRLCRLESGFMLWIYVLKRQKVPVWFIFPTSENCGWFPLALRSKAYSSKQAFIFTHHTPPAPPPHQRPHNLVSYEESIFHGKP